MFETRVLLSAIAWDGGAGTDNWHDDANWAGDVLPGPGDDVEIGLAFSGMTIVSTADAAVNSITSEAGLRLAAGVLSVAASTQANNGLVLDGGTLSGGTVHAGSGSSSVVATALGGTLDGVTVNGDIDLGQEWGAYLFVTNGLDLNGTMFLGSADGSTYGNVYFGDGSAVAQTFSGAATVVFGASGSDALYNYNFGSEADAFLTIAPGVLLRGHAGYVTDYWGAGTIINQGTIQADEAGGTIYVGGLGTVINEGTLAAVNGGALIVDSLSGDLGNASLSGSGSHLSLGGADWNNNLGLNAPAETTLSLEGTWTNSATITVNDSILNLGGEFTQAGLGTLNRSGGIVNLTGTVSGGLTLDAATGSWNLMGGTLSGGTLSQMDGEQLIVTASGGTLDALTANGDLDLGQEWGAYLFVTNGLELNGTMFLGSADGSTYGNVYFGDGSAVPQTFSGAATVVFGGSGSDALYNYNFGSEADAFLTIAPSVLLRGHSGYVYDYWGTGTIVNQGTIQADETGGTIYLGQSGSLINEGTLAALNGGTLTLSTEVKNAGGTVIVGGASVVDTLAGHNYVQLSGTTDLQGGALQSSGVVELKGGLLTGHGTILGDVVNGGLVDPGGANAGVLTIDGNYTQSPAGDLRFDLGGDLAGSEFDLLSVTGSATLAGALQVGLMNGFEPTGGGNFQVLTAASRSGEFASVIDLNPGDAFAFDAAYGASDVTLSVSSVPSTDLVVSQAAAPSAVIAGLSYPVSWTVVNQGNVAAGSSWSDAVYLSDDGLLDGGDTLLLTRSTSEYSPLAGGGNYVLNEQLTIPAEVAAGHKFLLFVADASNQQSESNDSNNVRAVAVQTGDPAPDLTVSELSVEPSIGLQSGDTLTVQWTVFNAGNTPITDSFYDYVTVVNTTTGQTLYGNYVYYDALVEGTIGPGQSRALQVELTLPDGVDGAGELEITVTTDTFDELFEDNADGTAESNNTAETTVTSELAVYPDLTITGLSVEPSSGLQSGGTLTIHWADVNSGDAAVSDSFYDYVTVVNTTTGQTLLGTYVYYDAVEEGAIEPGQSRARQYEFTLPDGVDGAGELTITVMTDAFDQLFEDNAGGTAEANNTAETTVTSQLAVYPDLTITGLSVDPSSGLQSGGTLTIHWTDINSGDAAVSDSFYDYVTIVNTTTGQTLLGAFVYYDATVEGAIEPGQSRPRQY
ncbi:MAG: CARDB domain-containing protein, partial [Planctomycetaceae bacterium]